MNFEEYVPLALRTCKSMPTPRDDFLHGVIGLSTEVGEFAQAMERVAARHSGANRKLDVSVPLYGATKEVVSDLLPNLREEPGDAFWYIGILSGIFQFPMYNPSANLNIRNFLPLSGLESTAADLLDMGKKWFIYEKEPDMAEAARLCQENIGYWLQILKWLGTTPEETMERNIAKLRKRYPEKYSNEDALARADKAEEAISGIGVNAAGNLEMRVTMKPEGPPNQIISTSGVNRPYHR